MKKALILGIVGLAATVTISCGQGYVWLDNYSTYGPLITFGPTGGGTYGAGIDSGFTVGLYSGKGSFAGSVSADTTPFGNDIPSSLHATFTLVTGANSTAQAGVYGVAGEFQAGGLLQLSVASGGTCTIMVVAYNGADYASSSIRGHSPATVIFTKGAGESPPAYVGYVMQSFEVNQTTCDEPPPEITQQPTNQIVSQGSSATFSVAAESEFPFLTYQWRFNGNTIVGATNHTLLLTNVQPTNAGSYFVVVRGCRYTNSTNVTLTVRTIPEITSHPQGKVGYWGKDVQFEVEAVGVPDPTYLWYKDEDSISWATNSVLTLTNLDFEDAGHYWVLVSNSEGSVPSLSALLVVNPAGVRIGLHPFVSIDGVVGYTYGIQYTPSVSDTSSWITLTNFTLMQPTQEWIDTSVDTTSGNVPMRFYRVIAVP